MNRHEKTQLWLPDYVHGRGGRTTAWHLRHVNGCQACQATLESLTHALQRPETEADETQLDKLLENIESEPQEHAKAVVVRSGRRAGRWAALRPLWQYFAFVAAAAAALHLRQGSKPAKRSRRGK